MPKQETERPITKNQEPKLTKGYIYFLLGGNDCIKIGKTIDIEKRVGDIGIQLPEEPVLLHLIRVKDYNAAETIFHEHYRDYRKNGEWFKLPKTEMEAIQNGTYPKGIGEIQDE